MLLYDLTQNLDEDTQIYPGDPAFLCHSVANVKEHGYNVTSLSLGSHTGTHIDAPSHFVEFGKTVDRLDLSMLVGSAVVLDLTVKNARERITWDDIISDPDFLTLVRDRHIVLIRTGWSHHWKTKTYLDHPFLDRSAAINLMELGVRVLGVDTLSPDQTMTDGSEGDFGVHESILGAGGAIVENLTGLQFLPSKTVQVSFLPLKLTGIDGSPIRAVAWADS